MTVSLAAIEAADKAATEAPWGTEDVYGLVSPIQIDGFAWPLERREAIAQKDADTTPKLAAAIRAVISVCQNTDGDWLDPSAEIPVGEVLRMLAEAGIDLDEVTE